MNKSEIRKIYQQKRFSLTQDQAESASKSIAENFIKNLLPKIDDFFNKKLAFYISVNNEVDPTFILKHCEKLGNIVALPKIIPNHLVLAFKAYQTGDKLIHDSKYSKLLEPANSQKNILPDIVFVPLIAFDKNCHRIGMGGGFYDATIDYLRKNYPKIIFIGLGYDWQNCEEIVLEKWDQSLDFIVSENNLVLYKQ